MGTWNYRIVRYHRGGYGLHAVYYSDDGVENAMTRDPVTFTGYPEIEDGEPESEGPRQIIDSLERAYRDARERPVFQQPAAWAENKEKPHDAD